MKKLHHLRKNYTKFQLNEAEIKADPLHQFNVWFEDAIEDGTFEANAMIVSTVNHENKPSSRVVLLKQIVQEGFIFFTHYESKKGNDLAQNTNASILFFWEKFERQIRIEGTIEKVPKIISDEYFKSRPIESQIGAILSKQSKPLDSRESLEKAFKEYDRNQKIVRPSTWGGYILKPIYFEFWQGRANRLHDRLVYEKNKIKWDIKRLYP